MKTAIKLVLIYFGFQILGALLAVIYGTIHSLIEYGDISQAQNISLPFVMLLGFLFMTAYLWKAGYISKEKVAWSPVSAGYLVLTIILYGGAVILIDFITSLMPWLPDIMKSTFDVLQSGWLGILCIAVIGPVLEELLFRGAITKVLLKKYSPVKAIVFSALVFGIFHINPAQVVSATLIGLLIGWVYYKTASLIPCILMHILNNSLSVFLNLRYPDVESTSELFTGNTYYFVLAVALVVFISIFWAMKKMTVPYPWKEETDNNI